MKLSELCAILKDFIANDESVVNYEIWHAYVCNVVESAVVLYHHEKQIVFEEDGIGSDSVADLLEYESKYANYEVCHIECDVLFESEKVELNYQKKRIIIS
jgi:hypothetical protein